MPQGNAIWLPSGIWNHKPETVTIPRMMLGTAKNFFVFYLIYEAFHQFRKMEWTYIYPNFVGNTMSFGTYTTLNHRAATTEEIDRMKAQARKKQL